jgi:hypothetical protein
MNFLNLIFESFPAARMCFVGRSATAQTVRRFAPQFSRSTNGETLWADDYAKRLVARKCG